MTRLILIVLVAPTFALVLWGVVGVTSHIGLGRVAFSRRAVEQFAPALYAVVVSAAALVAAALEGFSADRIGLIRSNWSPLICVVATVCAIPIGAAGYVGELMSAHRVAERRKAAGPSGGGSSGHASAGMRSLDQWMSQPQWMLAMGLVTALAEETLFRGYLMTGLRESLPVVAALALQAALFGVHHASFGWRAVPAKVVHGLVWGAMAVISGTILPAIVAHSTFQLLAHRRLVRQAAGRTGSSAAEALAESSPGPFREGGRA